MRILFNRLVNICARYTGTVFLMLFFCAMSYKVALMQSDERVAKITEQHQAELTKEKLNLYNLMAIRSNNKLDLIIQACVETNAVLINKIMLYCAPVDQLAPQQSEKPKHKQDEYIL